MPAHDSGKMGRSLNLFGATGVGVGAIVGGGVLALAGVAFASTGPSAMIAFAANGFIAVLTALSYAELSAAFPESGGTYTFSKKVLSVPAAFMVGWVVWLASMMASALYALGFASFAAAGLMRLLGHWGVALPRSLITEENVVFLALTVICLYSLSLIRKKTGGGQWATWGKVFVFAAIIASGLWALIERPTDEVRASLIPFFPGGMGGLFQAMGYTFIALQGFDIIAAVAGEVKTPEKTIPRAMLLSLGIALAIYLPMLLVIATVGVKSGQNIVQLSLSNPETIIAEAVQNYLGPAGYWMVLAAAILAMLSALQANLFAASRVAQAMARDRTLLRWIGRISKRRGTPIHAIVLSMSIVAVIVLLLKDVASSGAAASLIFLVSFALAHWMAILARIRGGVRSMPFVAPWFPVIHITGAAACLMLAIYQGIHVPSAGKISLIWLGLGAVLYLSIFAQRARIVDASCEAMDPKLLRLRGRTPLVLVPIANPATAGIMVNVASVLAPPVISRVLLLSVVPSLENWQKENPPRQLMDLQAVLREAMMASFATGLLPEALITVASNPWNEIIRVSQIRRCESLLVGLSNLNHPAAVKNLENLMSRVDADVAVLRAPEGWNFSTVKRILVPIGGRGQQDRLRARILGSLHHLGITRITFMLILPKNTHQDVVKHSRKWLTRLAEDELAVQAQINVFLSDIVSEEIIRQAEDDDLLILGLQRMGPRQKVFGKVALHIAENTRCGIILINRKG